MARPYWSGQVQLSLVSFGVKLFPATESTSQIVLHEIDRNTGERIRHQNVTASGGRPVDRSDIVKGYERSKGEYVLLEPKEIEQLRIPSTHTLEIVQFVNVDEIDLSFFEQPYFVVPEDEAQSGTFGVIRKALLDTGKAGLGEVAFAGREHLVALLPAPGKDSLGMMAYTLRYAEELRESASYFSDITSGKVDPSHLALAKELIRRNSATFDPSKFKDDYEAALQAVIDAKVSRQPLPKETSAPPRGNVINLMDALRRSLDHARRQTTKTSGGRPPAHRAVASSDRRSERKGPSLVESPARRRKSA
jgi:DNA end-binding protein Ku